MLHKQIATSVETITPEVAQTWLNQMVTNRSLRPGLVDKLARELLLDQWMLNGESIKFDWTGKLIDGQHRLNACITAQKPFQSIIVRNLDPDTFKTIDTGSSRRVSDILKINGEINTALLAATSTWFWRYEFLGHKKVLDVSRFPSAPDVIEILNLYPTIRDAVSFISNNKTLRGLTTPSISAFCRHIFSRINQELSDLFFDSLSTGLNLKESDAVYLLRERLLKNRATKKRMPENELVALFFKAWKYTLEGKQMKILAFKMDVEDLPEIELQAVAVGK